MSEAGASRRMVDGRWVVSRAWVMAYTGASAATVNRWSCHSTTPFRVDWDKGVLCVLLAASCSVRCTASMTVRHLRMYHSPSVARAQSTTRCQWPPIAISPRPARTRPT
jgi:hypothetical protein